MYHSSELYSAESDWIPGVPAKIKVLQACQHQSIITYWVSKSTLLMAAVTVEVRMQRQKWPHLAISWRRYSGQHLDVVLSELMSLISMCWLGLHRF